MRKSRQQISLSRARGGAGGLRTVSEAQSLQPVETPVAAPLEAELDRIRALSLDELRVLWRKMTQKNAPKALSSDLLARMLAYRIQEQTLGKLSRELRKLLDRLAKGGGEPLRHLKVGTVMVREHQGIQHEVMVVPGGFCWREQASMASETSSQWFEPRAPGFELLLTARTLQNVRQRPGAKTARKAVFCCYSGGAADTRLTAKRPFEKGIPLMRHS
jgi:hypothetical protein